jgi:hypothetical protein
VSDTFSFAAWRPVAALDDDLSMWSEVRMPPTPPWLTHERIMKIHKARTTWRYGYGDAAELMVLVPVHVLTPLDQERLAYGATILGMPMKVAAVEDFLVAARVVDGD